MMFCVTMQQHTAHRHIDKVCVRVCLACWLRSCMPWVRGLSWLVF
jgi:hypothetical protein